jgi:predicted transcriptional regulator
MKKIFAVCIALMFTCVCFSQEVEEDLYDNSDFEESICVSTKLLVQARDFIVNTKEFNTEEKLIKFTTILRKVENTIQACANYSQKFRKNNVSLEGYTKAELREMKMDAELEVYDRLLEIERNIKEYQYEVEAKRLRNMSINAMFFNF